MGISDSTLKLINDPINHCLNNCGHSDCETHCSDCFEFKLSTHLSRESEASVEVEPEVKKVPRHTTRV